MWYTLLGLAVAGALGALTRYFVSGWLVETLGPHFPWGTWAVNATGCFLFGLIWMLAERHVLVSPQARVILLSGYLGALTTFSTYVFETVDLAHKEAWLLAGLNLGGQLGLGVFCLLLGLALGRYW